MKVIGIANILNHNIISFSGRNNVKKEQGLNKVLKQDSFYYEKSTPGFNPQNVVKTITNRKSILPDSVAIFMSMPVSYLKNEIDSMIFASEFLSHLPVFYKRLTIAADSEKFTENYKPEVNFIKNLAFVCKKFNERQIDKKTFDYGVEDAISGYVATPVEDREFIFVN